MTQVQRLYERVSKEIAARISDGVYKIGQRLPAERELAVAFNVSRPSVREAIIALELDGLVQVRMGSGVYVMAREPRGGIAAVTDFGPFELLEARRAIEGEAAALAAGRISAASVEALEQLLSEMDDENDRDVKMSEDADRRFHMTIAEATGNSAIVQTIEMLWESRARSPQYQLLSRKVRAAGVMPRIDEHVAIVDALARRDPAAARLAMHNHLSRVIESLLAATESEAPEQNPKKGLSSKIGHTNIDTAESTA